MTTYLIHREYVLPAAIWISCASYKSCITTYEFFCDGRTLWSLRSIIRVLHLCWFCVMKENCLGNVHFQFMFSGSTTRLNSYILCLSAFRMNVGVAHSEVNPNTRVMNSRGIWLTYLLLTIVLHIVLLSIPFFTVPLVWTLTNVIHNLVS